MLTRPRLRQFLSALEGRLERPARLFLVGESALVEIEREPPADVLPLPSGFEGRARAADDWRVPPSAPSGPRLEVLHFDPVSVAFRLVARLPERLP